MWVNWITAGVITGLMLCAIDDWFARVMVLALIAFGVLALGVAWDATEGEDG